MATITLASVPEWRLLQGIGAATGGVKGRLASLRPKCPSRSFKQDSLRITEINDLALLETDLRFLLMWGTSHTRPLQSNFDQLPRELESLCGTLESIVNPVLLTGKEASPDGEGLLDPINGYNLRYSKLWKLRACLKASWSDGEKFDLNLVDGLNPVLFLVGTNQASQLLVTVTRCNDLLLQLSARESTSSIPEPASMPRSVHRSGLLSVQEQNFKKATIKWLQTFEYLRDEALPKGYQPTIRIAVLDTGYKPDLSQNARISKKVQKRWKDFLGVSTLSKTAVAGSTAMEVDEPAPKTTLPSAKALDEDKGLHGTRIVNLLYDLLPGFEIYVGRVTKNEESLANALKDIAAAITHAADPNGWNVDIITMSFGSTVRYKDVEDAILTAQTVRNRCILFFAAAGNEGGNQSENFPAALESVISVRGTYATSGFIHEYNPDPKPESEGRPLFGTLAYRVPCGPNDDEMSGCSIATPILAATAAVFIEFATSYANEQNWDEDRQRDLSVLKTRAGMLELFKDISAKANAANNRYYIAPELLFTTTGKWGKAKWFHPIQSVCYKIDMPE